VQPNCCNFYRKTNSRVFPHEPAAEFIVTAYMHAGLYPQIRSVDARGRISRLKALAHIFDNAIALPGGFRVGLDPIIGLIPGIGDAIGALLSGLILTEAARIGIPRTVLWRMIGNVLIDSLLGGIPFFGDLFDFAFKANSRNVDLLERCYLDPKGTRRSSRLLIAAAVAVCVFALLAIPALLVFGVVQLVKLF
jgi:hypothetical protein